ncbi:MAG TPA: hypothetical protein VM056_04285 [Terriglobales bacterium]|nr:hypothetical protein [Terriglobales bacterium]
MLVAVFIQAAKQDPPEWVIWLIALFAAIMFVLGIWSFWNIRLRHILMHSMLYHSRNAEVGIFNVICWNLWWGSMVLMFGLLQSGYKNETVLTAVGLTAGAALFGGMVAIHRENEAAIPASKKKNRKWITW